MRYQNRLMAVDDEIPFHENTVIVDQTEQSTRSRRELFNMQNPIFISSALGSIGVLCVIMILFRSQIYRICIVLIYGQRFFHERTRNSKLRHQSKHQSHNFHYHH